MNSAMSPSPLPTLMFRLSLSSPEEVAIDKNGQQVAIVATVFLDPIHVVDLDDTLTDENDWRVVHDSRTMTVVTISKEVDPRDNVTNHFELGVN